MHLIHKWEYGHGVRRCVKCGAAYHRNRFSGSWQFHGHTDALPPEPPKYVERPMMPRFPV
jgi:hypothetical protein